MTKKPHSVLLTYAQVEKLLRSLEAKDKRAFLATVNELMAIGGPPGRKRAHEAPPTAAHIRAA